MDALRRVHAQAEQRNELYRTLVARLREAIGAGTLAVEVRKGKMLVKLGDAILFDPGQATLKSDGQRALRQVAQALKEIPERDFLVAGHTDNRPIKSSPYASNWELSTARAVTVVRFLQSEGVDPRRLAAAGYSEFDALADNDTRESRARQPAHRGGGDAAHRRAAADRHQRAGAGGATRPAPQRQQQARQRRQRRRRRERDARAEVIGERAEAERRGQRGDADDGVEPAEGAAARAAGTRSATSAFSLPSTSE